METLKTIADSCIDGYSEAKRDAKKLKTGEETEWKGVTVGIDLGMSHSRIGLYCDDQMKFTVEIPSCVAFTDSGVLVGEEAMEHAIDNPTNTIFNMKWVIGRKVKDSYFRDDFGLWPFKASSHNGTMIISVLVNGREERCQAEVIVSIILKDLLKRAQTYIEESICNAVITVPSHFNCFQRQATITAAKIAGLSSIQLINESTAAYIGHGKLGKIMVFNLGAGCLDISLTEADEKSIVVKAITGDVHLGGETFSQRLLRYVATEYKKQIKDISGDQKLLRLLRMECEKAKKVLTDEEDTKIKLKSHVGNEFTLPINRTKFEELNEDLFKRCLNLVKRCMRDAKMNKRSLKEVILVGQSSSIPKIRSKLVDFFGNNIVHMVETNNVIDGACKYGCLLSLFGENARIRDISCSSFGFGVVGMLMRRVIPKYSQFPITRMCSSTFNDRQTWVWLRIFSGEGISTKNCKLLGLSKFSDFITDTRCKPRIEFWFALDANGLLTVWVMDPLVGVKKFVHISNDNEFHILPKNMPTYQADFIENYCKSVMESIREGMFDPKMAAVDIKKLQGKIETIKKGIYEHHAGATKCISWLFELETMVLKADYYELKREERIEQAEQKLRNFCCEIINALEKSGNDNILVTEIGRATEETMEWMKDEIAEEWEYADKLHNLETLCQNFKLVVNNAIPWVSFGRRFLEFLGLIPKKF